MTAAPHAAPAPTSATGARPDPFAGLTPDVALDALDAVGWRCDGRVLQLNSFENRVLLVHLEDGDAVVAKFYRPARWTDAQILEEHRFAAELAESEVPVAAPLCDAAGTTLHRAAAWRFAVFARAPGRGPELEQPGVMRRLGGFLGRMHAAAGTRRFEHRPTLDLDFGRSARDAVIGSGHLPPDSAQAWTAVADAVLDRCAELLAAMGRVTERRLHGDCHLGNILWTDSAGPHVVDLDDAVNGPAVQDLWMLLAGDADTARMQRSELLDGYEAFLDFDPREWRLVEALRSLRMLHHSGWIARRWHDPAFPAAFPWFGTPAYWSQQVTQLREQQALLDDALSGIEPGAWPR